MPPRARADGRHEARPARALRSGSSRSRSRRRRPKGAQPCRDSTGRWRTRSSRSWRAGPGSKRERERVVRRAVPRGRLHPLAILVFARRMVGASLLPGASSSRSPGVRRSSSRACSLSSRSASAIVVLEWRRFTYRIEAGRLVIERGVVRHTTRVVPLDRIRGVELRAPWLHRVLGLVRVDVEAAAGGGGAELSLAAVAADEGERLRGAPARGRARRGAEEGGAPRTRALRGDSPSARRRRAHERAHILTPLAVIGVIANFADDLPGGYVERLLESAADRAPTDVLGVSLAASSRRSCSRRSSRRPGSLLDGLGLRARRRRRAADRAPGAADEPRRRDRSRARARARPPRLSAPPRVRSRGPVRRRRRDRRGEGGPDGARAGDRVARGARARRASSTRRRDPTRRSSGTRARRARRRVVRAVARARGARRRRAGGRLGLGGAALLGCSRALGIPLGLDRYRQLGHGFDGRRVAVREGSLTRRWTSLDPGAVVSYAVERSPFQARSGLCTVVLHLGQGAGTRRVLDCSEEQAAALLARARRAAPRAVRRADSARRRG